ncbi:ABC transporter substrate-binding protein [Cellulosilyticum sp. WCF-2]|nr:ABC transporter substrate-binding protein [Cellulosilyticum sp. WCF-2]
MVSGALIVASVGCSSKTDGEASPSPVASGATATESPSGEAASPAASGPYYNADQSAEEIIKDAASQGKVGNWGLGNEYEIQALLAKYGQPITYLSQAFDMDGFDDDSILLASAMTYNELGLVKNDYDGAYKYGDTVKTIDMNDEGVAMLEDNLFCTKDFAEKNPNTVKAFIYASLRGWEYAAEHPEEAAEIVYKYGSSVSAEHQAYMATEVKKLVQTNTKGETVTNYGEMNEEAMAQTLELAKKYIQLSDSTAADALQKLTLDDIRDTSYWEAVTASADGKFAPLEKTDVAIQLKWLPQAQFMGYYVALDKGYYTEAGLNVTIVPGGGDIGETTAVYTGQVDFGVTWVSNLTAANAGGMNLLEIAQIYQRSGLVLVYKLNK